MLQSSDSTPVRRGHWRRTCDRRRETHVAVRLITAAGLALAVAAPAFPQAATNGTTQSDAAASGPNAPEDRTDPPVARDSDGNRHRIARIDLAFLRDHPNLPSESEVLHHAVELTRAERGWIAPRPDAPTESISLSEINELTQQNFYDSALTLLIQGVSQRLSDLDLLGVYAEVDPSQFEIADGRIDDLREPDDRSLRIQITTGVVGEVRTSALGERFSPEVDDPDETGEDAPGDAEPLVNHPAHEEIRRNSPLRPREGEPDPLLRRDQISDYALFLSRHPGRRVDISVAPSTLEPGTVTLDYLITENKPWVAYFQLSNTGTESTNEWQERFGFIHNQLTNADDVFTVEYVTNSFDGTNSVFASYERPLGLDGRLRGRVLGTWYEYDASSVGQPGQDFEGEGYSFGAEAILNVLQVDDAFVDAVAGVRFDRIEVTNDLALDPDGEDDIFLGYTGLRFERAQGVNRTFADLTLEWAFNGLDGSSENSLGRTEADDDWAVLRGGISQSIFLETLFEPDLAEAGSLAHELALSARGQWAFSNRLVPNYQQVAGGLFTARGYEQSIIAGDNALLATAEYRFHLPRSFAPSPEPTELFGSPFRVAPQYRTGPVDWDFQIKTFFDIARVENSDRLAFENDETLIGTGFGFELAVRRNLTARVDFGWALREVENEVGQTVVDKGDNEVHFLLTLAY